MATEREVLAELVRLKTLHDLIEHEENEISLDDLAEKYGSAQEWYRINRERQNEYDQCKTLAWEAARTILASPPASLRAREDAIDAARYRHLRSIWFDMGVNYKRHRDISNAGDVGTLDAAIDRALLASGREGEGHE